MRACRSAIWLIAMLGLVCLPALGAQHAQVGPQIITIPTGQPPGQPITIKVPNSAQLFALQSFFTGAFPRGGTRISLDPTDVTWVSSNSNIASVDTNGILTAVAPGPLVTITATYGRLTATVQVNVIGLTSLTMTPPSSTSIPIGGVAQFTATGNYSDCPGNPADCNVDLTNSVLWNSTNANFPIASGSPGGGKVKVDATAAAGDTSMISCKAGATACTPASVTVTAAQAVVVFVVVSPHSAVSTSLLPATYTANCIYSDGATTPAVTCSGDANHAGITINWTSGGAGDTGTAAVIGSGNTTTATALTNGTVTVIATPTPNTGQCLGAACRARLDVGLTSVDNPITPVPAPVHIAKGTTQQFNVIGSFGASTQDITNYVTWSAANISPITGVNISINRVGVATALGPVGSTANIYAGIDPCGATQAGTTFCKTTTAVVDPPNLVSIAIAPTTTSLPMGLKRQYTAIGTYTDKSTANITNSVVWNSSMPSSSNGADFSMTKPGQLTANSNATGSTTITATQNSITSNAVALTISPAVLSSVTVTPKNPSVPRGTNNFQFSATGKYSDGTPVPAFPNSGDANHVAVAALSWSSSAPNAATINSSGVADVIGTNGTSTIKATSGTVTGSTVLTVAPPTLQTITITAQAPSTLYVDGTVQYIATGTYSDNSTQDLTTTVNWGITGGTGSATISTNAGSEGVATGVSAGGVTVTASYTPPGGATVNGTLNVTVQPRMLQSIAVTPASQTLPPNQTQQYVATGTYSAGPNQDITSSVTWTETDQTGTGVANIDTSGLATTNSAGTATISASQGSINSGPQSATLTVSNPVLQSITITPGGNNVVVATNQTLQFTATGNYSDGSTQDLSAIATWSLKNNLGDSIDATGLYTAGKTPGSQTVFANCASGQCGTGSANASQNFTVTF